MIRSFGRSYTMIIDKCNSIEKVNWSKQVKSHVIFFHRPIVNMSELSRLLPKELKQLKLETQLTFYSSVL